MSAELLVTLTPESASRWAALAEADAKTLWPLADLEGTRRRAEESRKLAAQFPSPATRREAERWRKAEEGSLLKHTAYNNMRRLASTLGRVAEGMRQTGETRREVALLGGQEDAFNALRVLHPVPARELVPRELPPERREVLWPEVPIEVIRPRPRRRAHPLPLPEEEAAILQCNCRNFSEEALAKIDQKLKERRAINWHAAIKRDYTVGDWHRGSAMEARPAAFRRPADEIGNFTTDIKLEQAVMKGQAFSPIDLTGDDLLHMALTEPQCYCKGGKTEVDIRDKPWDVRDVACYSRGGYLLLEMILKELPSAEGVPEDAERRGVVDELKLFPWELMAKYGRDIKAADIRKWRVEKMAERIRGQLTEEDRRRWRLLRRGRYEWMKHAERWVETVPRCTIEVGREPTRPTPEELRA